MALLSSLVVKLSIYSADFIAKLRQSASASERWSKATADHVQTVQGAFRSVGGAALNTANTALKSYGIAATAALASVSVLFSRVSEAADKNAKFADTLGISVEALGGLQHAASLAGVSSDALGKNLAKMSRGIGDFSSGIGSASSASVLWLEKIGVANDRFFSSSPDQQFKIIADGIQSLGSQQEKAAATAAIFGKGTAGLIPLLASGSAGIAEMERESRILGITMSRIDAAKFEAANDSIERSKGIFSGIANKIGIQLAPLVTALSDKFRSLALEMGGFDSIIKTTFDNFITGTGAAVNAIQKIHYAWAVVRTITADFFATTFAGLDALQSSIVNFLNAMGGSFSTSNFISGLALSFKATTDEMKKNITELGSVKPQGDELVKWVKAAAAEASAEAVKLSNEAQSSIAKNSIPVTREIGNTADEKLAEKNQLDATSAIENNRLKNEALIAQNMIDNEQLAAAETFKHDAEMIRKQQEIDAIVGHGQQELALRETLTQQKLLLEMNYQQRLKKIKEDEMKNESSLSRFLIKTSATTRGGMLAELANFATASLGHSKKMFQLNKISGIANATVAMYESIAQSSKMGFPQAIPFIAMAAAKGAMAISGIKSQSFGGGGGGSSGFSGGVTSTPSADILPFAPARSTSVDNVLQNESKGTTIVINGDVNGQTAHDLINGLKSVLDDQDFILFSNSSAQAQELRVS